MRPPLWSSGQSSWLQIRRSRVRFFLLLLLKDCLCGLVVRVPGCRSGGPGFDSSSSSYYYYYYYYYWKTASVPGSILLLLLLLIIIIIIIITERPPLWSSGQSSWLQIRKSRVRFPGTTRKKVVSLELGLLSVVSATEELLARNSSGSGLEIREYGRRDSSRWPRGTLYAKKKLALTSLTSGGRSVSIVRLRTEFFRRNRKDSDDGMQESQERVSGLCSTSGSLNIRNHVSETGSVSVFWWGKGGNYLRLRDPTE
jgi:hypothetical protein